MTDQISKTLPHSLKAEHAVIGAMILYPDKNEIGLDKLDPGMFYYKRHTTIFSRISELCNKGQQVDSITITDSLKNHGELENVGGSEYIIELIESVISPINFEEHVKIIKDYAILRSVIQASSSTVSEALSAPGDVKEFLDRVEAKFFNLTQFRTSSDFMHIRAILTNVHDEIVSWTKDHTFKSGLRSGYDDLDDYLAGFHPSDYIVIAGRTSCGKTAFALSLARKIAVQADEKKRKPVAIFSLEMSGEQVAMRILSAEARVNSHKLRMGKLSHGDLNEIALSVKRLINAPIYIDDSPTLTVLEMRAKSRRLARQIDLGLIIVDYLQLITTPGRFDNRQTEVASISRSLKALSRELKIPVIALSQLSRRVEDSRDFRPKLSHLRESGAIEQDADVVLMIYRPEIHNIDTIKVYGKEMNSEGISNIIIAKQRNGPTGDVFLAFDKETISFEPLDIIEPVHSESIANDFDPNLEGF